MHTLPGQQTSCRRRVTGKALALSATVLLALGISTLSGCGGQTSNPTAITIAGPASDTIDPSNAANFTATVTGGPLNSGVSWSLVGCTRNQLRYAVELHHYERHLHGAGHGPYRLHRHPDRLSCRPVHRHADRQAQRSNQPCDHHVGRRITGSDLRRSLHNESCRDRRHHALHLVDHAGRLTHRPGHQQHHRSHQRKFHLGRHRQLYGHPDRRGLARPDLLYGLRHHHPLPDTQRHHDVGSQRRRGHRVQRHPRSHWRHQHRLHLERGLRHRPQRGWPHAVALRRDHRHTQHRRNRRTVHRAGHRLGRQQGHRNADA